MTEQPDITVPADAVHIVAGHCFGEAQAHQLWAVDIAALAVQRLVEYLVAAGWNPPPPAGRAWAAGDMCIADFNGQPVRWHIDRVSDTVAVLRAVERLRGERHRRSTIRKLADLRLPTLTVAVETATDGRS